MRSPEPSALEPALEFISGLGLLFTAYLLAVGSGMEPDVEHDRAHRTITLIAALLALAGAGLLWLSLRTLPRNRRR